jgi:DNA polymerase-1
LISGTQADMIKEAIGEIDKYIIDNNVDAILLLQVHDELVYKHKDEKFGEVVAKIMKETANKYLNGIIHMNAEYDTLRCWTK